MSVVVAILGLGVIIGIGLVGINFTLADICDAIKDLKK